MIVFFSVLAGILILIYWWVHPEPEISKTIFIPDSLWVIEDRVVGHTSALSNGHSEIVAKNTNTGEEKNLLLFQNIADTKVTIEKTGQIIINVPNSQDILEMHRLFGNTTVTYIFNNKC